MIEPITIFRNDDFLIEVTWTLPGDLPDDMCEWIPHLTKFYGHNQIEYKNLTGEELRSLVPPYVMDILDNRGKESK